jgi:hypothetical protein
MIMAVVSVAMAQQNTDSLFAAGSKGESGSQASFEFRSRLSGSWAMDSSA